MKITEKTGVSIGVLAMILGAMAWAYSTFASSKDVSTLADTLRSIDVRLSHIEGALGVPQHKQ